MLLSNDIKSSILTEMTYLENRQSSEPVVMDVDAFVNY